jgi:hypothetical protein
MTARVLFLGLAAVLLTALLDLPMDITALRHPWFWAPPLELVSVAALALALGPARVRAAGLVAVAILLPLVLLALLEALVFGQFGRPLRLSTDLLLLPVLLEVVRGEVLPAPLLLAGGGIVLAVPVLLGGLIHGFAAGLARLPGGPHRRAAALLLLAGLAAFGVQRVWGSDWRHWRLVSTDGIGRVVLQLRWHRRVVRELAHLERAVATDPLRHDPPPLARLEGVDVAILFVESWGRVALEQPPFAHGLRPKLAAWEGRLAASGLHLASGFLESPTIGGQSWLAHETLLTGLRIDDEAARELLFTKQPTTLAHLFRRTGHDTRLVMPAMTRPWPESARLGFDRLLIAKDLGYAGPPFGFAPVPDQFTLAVLAREAFARPRGARPPVFAQVVLATSHAPFTPVPELLPWEAVGDGRAFLRFTVDAEPPARIWQSRERIREAYARAVGYSLDAAFAFAARIADRCTLVLILGDHPPAATLTGDHARTVPAHLVAGDPELLAPFLREAGFSAGALPDAAAPARGMEEVRDLFVRAFGTGRSPCGRGTVATAGGSGTGAAPPGLRTAPAPRS